MLNWFRELDRVLRGDATGLPALRAGKIEVSVVGLSWVLLLLGGVYGFCMGWFALFNRADPELRQVAASVIKVPALFALSLVVTFPSLYVFNALIGSRLAVASTFRLLIVALRVILAVLSSFGPIVAFFSLTTTSYPFMVLLNVAVFTLAGCLGLAFLLQTLHRLSLVRMLSAAEPLPSPPDALEPSDPAGPSTPGALDAIEGHVLGPHVKKVFFAWMIVFALVGAQMAWVLRPFIGSPDRPFQWLRPRQSNFFEAVLNATHQMLGSPRK